MPRNANKDKLSNYSIKFDAGSSDEIVTTFLGTGQTEISISAWINLDSIGSAQTIFGTVWASSTALTFDVDDTGKLRLFFRSGGNPSPGLLLANTVLSASTWYHAAVTLTPNGSNMDCAFYLNGVIDNTTGAPQAYGQGDTAIASSGTGYNIGSTALYLGASYNFFNGKIGQLSVFDYVLSSTQITYLNNLNNPMAITGAEPVAYWPLGDNSNPTANAGYPNISVGADSVFDFNGSQAIDVPAVDLGVNGSISIWFNPETGGVADFVLVGEGSQGFDYVIRRSSGVFIIWIGSTFYQFAGFGSNVVTGGWNFLVLTKSAGNVNLYLKNSNGEFSVSRTESNWASASLKFDRIGARTITPINLGFQGEISNFQAWDSVLLSTEITTLYNNGQPLITGAQPQATNLKAWYKLNQHDSYWDLGGNGKWTFNNAAIN